MTRRSLVMQITLTVLLFAAYLAFYAVLDGVGLGVQREEMVASVKQLAKLAGIGGLVIAGLATLWATLVSFFNPGEYQMKPAVVAIVGVAMWYFL